MNVELSKEEIVALAEWHRKRARDMAEDEFYESAVAYKSRCDQLLELNRIEEEKVKAEQVATSGKRGAR